MGLFNMPLSGSKVIDGFRRKIATAAPAQTPLPWTKPSDSGVGTETQIFAALKDRAVRGGWVHPEGTESPIYGRPFGGDNQQPAQMLPAHTPLPPPAATQQPQQVTQPAPKAPAKASAPKQAVKAQPKKEEKKAAASPTPLPPPPKDTITDTSDNPSYYNSVDELPSGYGTGSIGNPGDPDFRQYTLKGTPYTQAQMDASALKSNKLLAEGYPDMRGAEQKAWDAQTNFGQALPQQAVSVGDPIIDRMISRSDATLKDKLANGESARATALGQLGVSQQNANTTERNVGSEMEDRVRKGALAERTQGYVEKTGDDKMRRENELHPIAVDQAKATVDATRSDIGYKGALKDKTIKETTEMPSKAESTASALQQKKDAELQQALSEASRIVDEQQRNEALQRAYAAYRGNEYGVVTPGQEAVKPTLGIFGGSDEVKPVMGEKPLNPIAAAKPIRAMNNKGVIITSLDGGKTWK